VGSIKHSRVGAALGLADSLCQCGSAKSSRSPRTTESLTGGAEPRIELVHVSLGNAREVLVTLTSRNTGSSTGTSASPTGSGAATGCSVTATVSPEFQLPRILANNPPVHLSRLAVSQFWLPAWGLLHLKTLPARLLLHLQPILNRRPARPEYSGGIVHLYPTINDAQNKHPSVVQFTPENPALLLTSSQVVMRLDRHAAPVQQGNLARRP
jgi:hypothetical protein